MYFDELLPRLVKKGSDGNAGSSALCDTTCLQVQMIFMLNPTLSFMFFGCTSTFVPDFQSTRCPGYKTPFALSATVFIQLKEYI
ncbi:Chorismate mutase 1 chloroplastic [Zea mays]|uniref:chorismate mutase n=1 Tax=Zea mays TaxID=4577 RepID=A0A1D6NAW6_MAIZE|nr:Chorismate mutase 1 chloroplastic [Zea mays]